MGNCTSSKTQTRAPQSVPSRVAVNAEPAAQPQQRPDEARATNGSGGGSAGSSHHSSSSAVTHGSSRAGLTELAAAHKAQLARRRTEERLSLSRHDSGDSLLDRGQGNATPPLGHHQYEAHRPPPIAQPKGVSSVG